MAVNKQLNLSDKVPILSEKFSSTETLSFQRDLEMIKIDVCNCSTSLNVLEVFWNVNYSTYEVTLHMQWLVEKAQLSYRNDLKLCIYVCVPHDLSPNIQTGEKFIQIIQKFIMKPQYLKNEARHRRAVNTNHKHLTSSLKLEDFFTNLIVRFIGTIKRNCIYNCMSTYCIFEGYSLLLNVRERTVLTALKSILSNTFHRQECWVRKEDAKSRIFTSSGQHQPSRRWEVLVKIDLKTV